jgi:alanine-synthesizing transaminase
VPPKGAFYAFPRFELGALKDTELVRDLILQHGVVVVHGSGFGQDDFNHIRIVFLPPEELLAEAYDHIAEYSLQALGGKT